MAATLDFLRAFQQPAESFPASLQPTVRRMKWLRGHWNTITIFFHEILGKGSHGTVFKGAYISEEGGMLPIAIKVTKKPEYALHEAEMLWKLSGVSHMVELHGIFTYVTLAQASTPNTYVLQAGEGPNHMVFTRLIDSPPLHKIIVNKDEVQELARQLFQCISEIHAKQVVHGDIDPKNLFWKDKCLTVIDVSYSGELGHLVFPQITGGDFRAPEVTLNQRSRYGTGQEEARYNEKADVYSAGVIVHFVMTRQLIGLSGEYHPEEKLACLVKRIGMPPTEWLQTQIARDTCFTEDSPGHFALRPELEPKEPLQPLEDYYKDHPKLLDFLKNFIYWDSAKRLSAKDALEHPYLKD